MVGAGHYHFCAEAFCLGLNAFGVGGHVDFFEDFNFLAVFVDPLNHGFSTDEGERLLEEAR